MDNKKIEIFYEQVDKAVMKLYDELRLNYLDGLIRVGHDLVYETNENGLSEETVNELNEIYDNLKSTTFFNEELRASLQLLIVKAFKHIGYSLDLMTPDSVNYLIAHLISKLCPYPLDILDTCVGTSNMLNAIIDFPNIEVLEAIGIDNDLSLVNLSATFSDLLNNGVKVYYQNAASPIIDTVDVVVGDLPHQLAEERNGYNYLPYQIISERMNNLRSGGYFIYLINNDFFSYPNNNKFKEELEKEATLLGLFILDEKMFKNPKLAKSILVGVKDKLDSYDMMVQLVKLDNEKEIEKVITSIDKWIENIRSLL